jgi:NAD(P)-dependent dehydrogenase (short-subunit alcohol dehydrogenase family)
MSTTSARERPRTALVAGGSRGLGLLVARELAGRGLRTTICARDPEEVERAVRQLRQDHGLELQGLVCDVADGAAVRQMVREVEREHGGIDVAIHVAGVIQAGPLTAVTEDLFREAIDIMVWGPIHLALAVLPGMRDRGFGRLGTVTSIGGVVSPPHLLPYATAKFGAVGFSQGLHADLAGTDVTATTIVPGLMRTGSDRHALFTGDPAKEYAWFSVAASLPLLSMDAERAARLMVDAVLGGRPMVILTPLAKVATRFAALAPSTTTRLLRLASRALPTGSGPGAVVEGSTARRRLGSVVVDRLTTLGTRAAQRFNEVNTREGDGRVEKRGRRD